MAKFPIIGNRNSLTLPSPLLLSSKLTFACPPSYFFNELENLLLSKKKKVEIIYSNY